MDMDRLIVLDRGSIVADGSHDELLRQGGLYADLWRRQSGGFNPVEDPPNLSKPRKLGTSTSTRWESSSGRRLRKKAKRHEARRRAGASGCRRAPVARNHSRMALLCATRSYGGWSTWGWPGSSITGSEYGAVAGRGSTARLPRPSCASRPNPQSPWWVVTFSHQGERREFPKSFLIIPREFLNQ